MAAKPVQRYVTQQVKALGGWDALVDRIASGETVADLSRLILRAPGGPCISRNFLSMLLHADPIRSARIKQAHLDGAAAMVDDALHIVDSTLPDRDSVNKAKVRADLRVKVAGLKDREAWGEKPMQLTVNQFSHADYHLDALRHRMIEASAPLAVALGQTGQLALMPSSMPSSSPESVEGAVPQACETEATVSRQHSDSVTTPGGV